MLGLIESEIDGLILGLIDSLGLIEGEIDADKD